MISIKNLSKYYLTKSGRSYVFRDISLDIPTCRSIALLGPNGVGKSTLINILGGAERQNAGTIETDKRISWPLGLKGGLQGSMSGRENVRFVARIHGYRDTSDIETQVADFADIGKYYDEPVKSYSSGMKSKVAFGLSMAFDFDFEVLLLDEITAVGDRSFREKSEALLRERIGDTCVIMVNHSISQLRKYCEAALILGNSKITYYENFDEAVGEYERQK